MGGPDVGELTAVLVPANRAVFHGPDAGGKPVYERAVVEGHQHRSRKGVERLLELLSRGYIKVVHRLIEYEKVGPFEDQLGQQQPRALTVAQTGGRK